MNAEEHPQTEPAVKWCTTIFGSNAFAQQENIEPLLSTLDYDDKYAVCMNWSTIFILKASKLHTYGFHNFVVERPWKLELDVSEGSQHCAVDCDVNTDTLALCTVSNCLYVMPINQRNRRTFTAGVERGCSDTASVGPPDDEDDHCTESAGPPDDDDDHCTESVGTPDDDDGGDGDRCTRSSEHRSHISNDGTTNVSRCTSKRFRSVGVTNNAIYSVTDDNIFGEVRSDDATSSSCYSFIPQSFHISMQIKSISCGKEHVVALSCLGAVLTMGKGSRGQLGRDDVMELASLKLVEPLEGAQMLSVHAGGWHCSAVTDCGDVYTWGWNESGQLGLPCSAVSGSKLDIGATSTINIQTVPHLVHFPVPHARSKTNSSVVEDCHVEDSSTDISVVTMSCGSRHTAALTECGLLYTWGWNKYGQLGHGDHDSRDVPTLLTLEQHGRTNCDVICGAWNTCVITREKATI